MNQTWTNATLKENAKKLFKKNYWVCVGVSLLIFLFTGSGLGNAGSAGVSILQDISEIQDINIDTVIYAVALVCAVLKIFLFNVIEVGGKAFFIQNKRQTPNAVIIFDGFKSGHYLNIVKAMFIRDIQIFLWTLLFVIPGAIKSYEYLMVPYLLAENPSMDSKDVLSLSRRMMDGEKGDAFILALSFIGWDILTVITCGLVGIFYANPYYLATFAELYAYLKEKTYDKEYLLQE